MIVRWIIRLAVRELCCHPPDERKSKSGSHFHCSYFCCCVIENLYSEKMIEAKGMLLKVLFSLCAKLYIFSDKSVVWNLSLYTNQARTVEIKKYTSSLRRCRIDRHIRHLGNSGIRSTLSRLSCFINRI